MNICTRCNAETNNPKFCSRSCSVAYNNAINPKVKKAKKCLLCDRLIYRKNNYCQKCNPRLGKDYTLLEIKTNYMNHKQPRSNWHSYIRYRARQIVKFLPQKCFICQYDKHVETCHKKPIKEFTDDSKLSEVNHIDNLILLCPNHHWEMDNK